MRRSRAIPRWISCAAAPRLRPRQLQVRVMWQPGAQRPSARSTDQGRDPGNLTAETSWTPAAAGAATCLSIRLRPAAYRFGDPGCRELREGTGSRGRSFPVRGAQCSWLGRPAALVIRRAPKVEGQRIWARPSSIERATAPRDAGLSETHSTNKAARGTWLSPGAPTESWPWRLTRVRTFVTLTQSRESEWRAAGEPEILGGVVRGTGAGGENTIVSFLGVTT